MNPIFTSATISAIASIGLIGMTGAAAETPRLHPVKEVCIDYEMTGQMMNGTTTRCHRNFGYEQYEIQDTTVGFAGITQAQKSHTITIGDTIYAIDTAAGTGTKTKNPIYQNVADRLKDTSSEDMAASFIAAMGYSPSGASKKIAGHACDVYSAPQMGTACLTKDGLLLEQDVMGNKQTATSVTKGDGGDDANYALYQSVTISEGPDLSNGLQGLIDQLGNQ